MLRKTALIILLICLLIGLFIGMQALETVKASHKQEEARKIFLQGVSILIQTGGIASFEVPESLDPFTQERTQRLSTEEIEQLVKEALIYLKRSLEIDPSFYKTHYYLGVAYIKIHMVDEAIEAFQRSIQFEPDRILTYNLLCGLLWEKRRYEEALKFSKMFLHKFPTKRALGNFLIGKTYYESGKYEQAIEMGKDIVLLDNRDINGHLLLATSYHMLKKYNESELEFKKVIEIDPRMVSEIEKIKKGLKKKSQELESSNKNLEFVK